MFSKFSKFISNIFWLSFEKIFKMFLSFFLFVLIARVFGPSIFGTYNYVLSIVFLFGVISSLGLKGVVIEDMLNFPNKIKETINVTSILLFISGLIAYWLCILYIYIYRANDGTSILLMFILGSSLLFKFSDIVLYYYESQVNSKIIVISQLISFIILFFFKLLVLIFYKSIFVVGFLFSLEVVFNFLIFHFLLRKKGFTFFSFDFNFIKTKYLIRKSFPLIISSFAVIIYLKIDQIMLGEMLGDYEVGIYSVAVKVSDFFYFIPSAIVSSYFPILNSSSRSSNMKVYSILRNLYRLLIIPCICISLFISFFSSIFLNYFFGESYQESVTVLIIHIWGLIFASFGMATSKYFLVKDLLFLNSFRSVLGAVLNILLNLFFIPKFNVLGAAISTLITQIFINFILDIFNSKTRFLFYIKLQVLNPYNYFNYFKLWKRI